MWNIYFFAIQIYADVADDDGYGVMKLIIMMSISADFMQLDFIIFFCPYVQIASYVYVPLKSILTDNNRKWTTQRRNCHLTLIWCGELAESEKFN